MNDLLINETYKYWYKDDIKYTFFKYILQHLIDKNFIIKVPIQESFTSLLSFTTTYREHFYNKKKFYGTKFETVMIIYDTMLTCYNNDSTTKYDNIYKILEDKNAFGLDNKPCIKQDVKSMFMNYIYKAQNTYFAMLKFIKICKIKCCKPFNSEDLFMENIEKPCYIFHLNKLYLFSKSDINHLFYNSLISSNYEFHSSPKMIKNPYINIKFTYNILIQLYFHYKFNSISYNNVIETFFKANFKLNKFVSDNDTMITELNIKRYLNNSNGNDNEIIVFLKEMINYANKNIITKRQESLSFCKLFPIKIYINTYKPYLMQYLLFRYCSDSSKSYDSFNVFKKKIIRFHKNSPKFGRSILHLPNKKRSIILPFKTKIPNEKYFTYETKHINYYNNDYTEETCEPILAKNILKRKYDDDDDDSLSSEISDSDTESNENNESNESNEIITNISNDLTNIITSILDEEANPRRFVMPIDINYNISENILIDQNEININIDQVD